MPKEILNDVENILPVYHKEKKSRHDVLCGALSKKGELKSYTVNQISDVVLYIEELVADCVEIAQDELYGAVSKNEVKDYIRKKSISDKDEVIDIIFEIANYYARR